MTTGHMWLLAIVLDITGVATLSKKSRVGRNLLIEEQLIQKSQI